MGRTFSWQNSVVDGGTFPAASCSSFKDVPGATPRRCGEGGLFSAMGRRRSGHNSGFGDVFQNVIWTAGMDDLWKRATSTIPEFLMAR